MIYDMIMTEYIDYELLTACCAMPFYANSDICMGCNDHSAIMEDVEK